jgi:ABC-type cobalamin/Fe3+-siderophores transport system ATPase subunit
MIKLKKIEYHINQKLILQDINLNIEQGKTTIIMGKNGSGKSTLLKLLNQIIQPTSGLFQSLLDKPIPMLFQKPLTLKNTVNYNYQILQKIKKNHINKDWFNKFNLAKLENQKINSLSGGEKQKLFLARLMSFDQLNLFLDEPNQSLDLESERLLVDLLLYEKKNKTIILTLHDFEIAKKIGDYFIYLENGKILLQGNANKFFDNFSL